jgi:hypothetical protein
MERVHAISVTASAADVTPVFTNSFELTLISAAVFDHIVAINWQSCKRFTQQ